MTLHDWIDELCDALDIEAEVDEALVLDLARDAAHNVERPAAPITTYLLGYAAATELAEKWGVGDQEIVSDDVEDVEDLDEALVDVD